MKIKKMACSILAIAMLVFAFCPALNMQVFANVTTVDNGDIHCEYVNIANIGAGLKMDSLGRAVCGGFVTLWDAEHTCDMTIDLQRYNYGWNSIKTWSFSGSPALNETKYWYVTSGYYYRVVVTIEVYNSSNVLVETESATSSNVLYN